MVHSSSTTIFVSLVVFRRSVTHINGAGEGTRTPTVSLTILSRARLPIPPHRQKNMKLISNVVALKLMVPKTGLEPVR